MSRPAAAANSSATAMTVWCNSRPCRSSSPRWSSSGSSPDTPSANSTKPSRHGRPNVSVMTTPMEMPRSRSMANRNRRAEASGSFGRRMTTSSASVLDASTPELAHTQPCLLSVMTTPFFMRTIRLLSLSTTSTMRGSLSHISAICRANVDGVTVPRSTTAPSAFDTIFWHITRMSPSLRPTLAASIAASSNAGRSSPGWIWGTPGTGMMAIVLMGNPRVRPQPCRARLRCGCRTTVRASATDVSISRMRVSVTTTSIPSARMRSRAV